MIRLKDIALTAGVSVMTVSKVLRDAPDISAATKVRIRALAQQMGYVPDTMAQSLRTRATKLFGLVIPATTNQNFARIIMAVEEQAHELGFDVILAHTLNDAAREELIIRRLVARRVHGLFIAPVYRLGPEANAYRELLQKKVPTVLLGHRAPFCSQFAAIESDDIAGSQALTQHLIQSGHRRIAFLAGPPLAPASQERLDGYKRALTDAQIPVDDRIIYPGGNTIEEGEAAITTLLNEKPDITAIQCFNDTIAAGVIQVLTRRGYRIPEDVSIVGFGNILLSEYGRVPLTTARQPKHRMGKAAVALMTKLLRGEPPEVVRIRTPLELRASVGPPSAKPLFEAPPAG